jgi:hypothetical protein
MVNLKTAKALGLSRQGNNGHTLDIGPRLANAVNWKKGIA